MQRREETQSRQDGDPVKPTTDTGGLMEAATGSSRRTLSSSPSRPQQSRPLSCCQSSGPWKDGRNLCWCSCGQENSPHQPTCFLFFFRYFDQFQLSTSAHLSTICTVSGVSGIRFSSFSSSPIFFSVFLLRLLRPWPPRHFPATVSIRRIRRNPEQKNALSQ